MSTKKAGESSFSSASDAGERTETYKSSTTEATSKTKLGDDVYSYTRVSRISQGFFDNDDLALRHYDEAKDTFTALEAAYKRLLLQVEAMKDERRYEVNFICSFFRDLRTFNKDIPLIPNNRLYCLQGYNGDCEPP